MPLFAIVTLVFLGIASVLFSLFYLLVPKKTVLEERIESLTPYKEEFTILERPLTAWQKFLARRGKKVPLRPQDYGKYMKMLVAAGIKKERITVFMGVKLLLTLVLPFAYLSLYGIPVEKDPMMRILWTVGLAIAGFLIPTVWLRNKLKNRQIRIF